MQESYTQNLVWSLRRGSVAAGNRKIYWTSVYCIYRL